jgi:hypothetical protein
VELRPLGLGKTMDILPLYRVLSTVVLAAALGAGFGGGAAKAADDTTIVQDITVDRPADAVWKTVGGFCDIKAWLSVSCVYTSGAGDVGTVRRLADRIDEVMVGKTPRSYTYTQPTTTILYHGTLDVQADGPGRSKIVYTLVYDQAPLATAEAQAADRAQRAKTFAGALANMKKLAEAK